MRISRELPVNPVLCLDTISLDTQDFFSILNDYYKAE
jgi:hypothetical protein